MYLIKGVGILKETNSNVDEFEVKDILFDRECILEIGMDLKKPNEDCVVIDGKGLTALPGLIDVHVHLREPGNEYKETIRTGTEAAAAGGFTTIMAMPNVYPFPDDAGTMIKYQKLIDREAVVDVIPLACITDEERGNKVVDMEAIKNLGYTAFSDDGVGVQKDEVMEEAMKKSAELDVMIVAHTEDMNYRKPGACMNAGSKANQLGLLGIPNECEFVQLERDLKLVEKTGAHYHCCHMSTAESVELIRKYKKKGCDVSGEAGVHHLILTDEDVKGPNWKMNPPLRSEKDRRALIEGIRDGSVEIIANDHAPHSEEEKSRTMENAPFGIVTIETAFPLLYTYLVKKGEITLGQLTKLMSENPARRFSMGKRGKLEKGYRSDLILVDLKQEYKINKEKFYSKGKNTPFDGWKCYGKIMHTFVRGDLVYKEDQ